MPRFNRHGWRHERQPEHVFRIAIAAIIIAFIIVAAFTVFGH